MEIAKIRVLVNGHQGKMGQACCIAISEDPELELVGRAGQADDLKAMIAQTKAQVVVDFTQPDAVFENTMTILEAGAHPVIGTTGLTDDQIGQIAKRAETLKRGTLIAPNFALGVLLMMKFSQEAAHYFPNAEIIERHAPHKIDAPSGTAIETAKRIAAGRQDPIKNPLSNDRARGEAFEDTQIHAIRLPGSVAHQSVIFGGHCETFTISHDSLDRKSFMPGVVLACKKIGKHSHLINSLDKILFADHTP